MVLDSHRDKVDGILDPLTEKFIRIEPNTITWVSLFFSFVGGYLIYTTTLWVLPLATFFIVLASLFDALDGKVARKTGKSSKRGDFLDHTIDRYADVLLIAGIALSGYCRLEIGFFAVIGVLLTSYMGTQSQALGCKRNYRGVLVRADRMVILILAPLVQFATGHVNIWHFTIFEYIMLLFAIAGNITAVQRALHIWNALRGK
jgi:archaetidylinositol phosphate synthase